MLMAGYSTWHCAAPSCAATVRTSLFAVSCMQNYLDRMNIRWSTRTQVEEEDKEDDDTETGGDPGTTVYGSAGSHVAAHASLLSHEESYYNTMDE